MDMYRNCSHISETIWSSHDFTWRKKSLCKRWRTKREYEELRVLLLKAKVSADAQENFLVKGYFSHVQGDNCVVAAWIEVTAAALPPITRTWS